MQAAGGVPQEVVLTGEEGPHTGAHALGPVGWAHAAVGLSST